MIAYFRLLLRILWLLLLCAVTVSFVLSNGERVSLRLYPLPFEASLPVYALAGLVLFGGVLVGVAFASFHHAARQLQLRRKYRESERRALQLERDLQLREAAERAQSLYVSGASPVTRAPAAPAT